MEVPDAAYIVSSDHILVCCFWLFQGASEIPGEKQSYLIPLETEDKVEALFLLCLRKSKGRTSLYKVQQGNNARWVTKKTTHYDKP